MDDLRKAAQEVLAYFDAGTSSDQAMERLRVALAQPEQNQWRDAIDEALVEARKPTALLDWGLYVDCHKCSLTNNLASGLHDVEHDIARHIFTNAWDKLEGWEVTCEGCDHEFTIERVEY